ncbi:LysE family translocator [Undibacterium jejuense]|uniref:LysE family translocator n=1 Tax=Undibacterium jejuense TaxID=1344949 RepID=A0A923HNC0_9BURK|nr:LysE family translocator [Undibacterium jejuense]MBC3861788.1 LysE family translocator [Undibacterium jejuense]
MLTFQTALTFFGVSILLGLSPGPDNVFVLMQSATQGRKAGMLVVLGLCTGLIVHTIAIALGLAAVFAASAVAFLVLKCLGAAYLAYLAWGAFRAPVSEDTSINATALRPRQLYLRGVIMNLTNPKVVFFFLAFLPQFVSAERGSVAFQFVELGAIFILATIIAFGSISYFAATVGQRLRGSASAQRWMNRAAAFVFAGLALKLAFSQR